MKHTKTPRDWFFLLLVMSCLAASCIAEPVPPYDFLRATEVRPSGWIREQMRLDLRDSITGHYEKISDNVNGGLFATRQRRPGTMVVGNRGLAEKAWWAGEHEGYWKDSIVRMAFLTGNERFQAKARAWMEEILTAQQEDGYIGIYTRESRFPGQGFDGELWTQSRIFQAMLAYHEFTGDRRVLEAVERAAQCTLSAYRDRTYFHRPKPDGGVAHGIGYMDTLEWLYRLTGKEVYRQGALWLYGDLAREPMAFVSDLMPQTLAAPGQPWNNHAPHILEGLHMPQIVHALGGGDLFRRAADSALMKLARHTNPGGGLVGSENVDARMGAGDMPAEYCSLAEGASSLNRIVAWRGELSPGTFVERLSLNAAQGARFHPANAAVVYLHFDNQLDASDPARYRGRCLFSASHLAAACCPLNAGRLLPYHVEGMWYRDRRRNGLAACLFGPCQVETAMQGVAVRIKEETDYPFSSRIRFTVEARKPVRFPLILRIPDTAGPTTVEAGRDAQVNIDRQKSEIVIENTWEGSMAVAVDFQFHVERRRQNDGLESYYQWGALLFSLPLQAKIEQLEELATVSGVESGFFDYRVTASNRTGVDWRIDPEAAFQIVAIPDGDRLNPWSHPPIALRGNMRNASGQPVEATLKPYGSSILRRTTFPVYAEKKATRSAGGIAGREAQFTFPAPVTKGTIYVAFSWRQLGRPLAAGWSGIELNGDEVTGSFAGRPSDVDVFGLSGSNPHLSTAKADRGEPVKMIVKYDLDSGKVSLWIDPDTTRVESTHPPDATHCEFQARSVRSVDTHVSPTARTEFGGIQVFTSGKTPFGD